MHTRRNWILGIESSCDETGIAIVDRNGQVKGQALHSQIAMHREYGGVVPELASRDHIQRLQPLLAECLAQARCSLLDIGAIAYTAGPGLPGALLSGASFAAGLAMALNCPLIPVHHLEGHLLSPLLSATPPAFPFTALLVSGGHSQLMAVERLGDYRLLGETLDDAAGEAFDKTAKMMGLPYPGGPALSALAEQGDANRFKLPRPMLHSGDLNFSFSGLKTAVLTTAMKLSNTDKALEVFRLSETDRCDLAAAFQAAIVDVLCEKAIRATRQVRHARLVVAGGVGANRSLRTQLTQRASHHGIEVFYPPPSLCTDNGAMIALAAALNLQQAASAPAIQDDLAIDSLSPTIRSQTSEKSCGYRFETAPRWPLGHPDSTTDRNHP